MCMREIELLGCHLLNRFQHELDRKQEGGMQQGLGKLRLYGMVVAAATRMNYMPFYFKWDADIKKEIVI